MGYNFFFVSVEYFFFSAVVLLGLLVVQDPNENESKRRFKNLKLILVL